MPSIGKKILIGAIAADVATALFLSLASFSILTGWLVLNVLVIIPAILIRKAIILKRCRSARLSKRGMTSSSKQDYRIECITLKGETVKSRGEKKIADYFFENEIKYEYETSALTNGRHRDRIIGKPDFYLPQYDVFVEYWGMVNTEDKNKRKEYVKSMKWKMAKYRENGIKFISLYPDNLHNLDWIFKSKLREATGIDLNKQ